VSKEHWLTVTHDTGETSSLLATPLTSDGWLLTVAQLDAKGEPVRTLIAEADGELYPSVRDALTAGFAAII
jgi:hypothetical protein